MRTSNPLPVTQGGCENLPGLPIRGEDPAGRAPVRSTQGSAVTTLGSDPVRVHLIAPSPSTPTPPLGPATGTQTRKLHFGNRTFIQSK